MEEVLIQGMEYILMRLEDEITLHRNDAIQPKVCINCWAAVDDCVCGRRREYPIARAAEKLRMLLGGP